LKKDVAELALLPHFKKLIIVDRENKNKGKKLRTTLKILLVNLVQSGKKKARPARF